MAWFASNIRAVFWIAVIPAALLVPARLARAARTRAAPRAAQDARRFFAGFRQLDKETKRLLAVGFLFALARFSEGFLILKGIDDRASAKRCRR